MELEVTREVLARMAAESARSHPEECCGILFGRGDRIDRLLPAANVAENRRRRFEIDPQALIDAHRAARAGGPEVAGYYHSHPAGLAEPSATDRDGAAGDGKVWAIIGASDVTFWRDGEQGFERLFYRPVDL